MSDPHDLPARVSLPQPGESSPCHSTAGLDWGATGHAVCVLEARRRVARFECATPPPALPSCWPAWRGSRPPPSCRSPSSGRPASSSTPRRGRSPGRPHPPQRGQGLPSPLSRRRRQERPGRRLHARRHPAHRRPPLPPPRARSRRDQGLARPGPRPRRPRRHACGPRQPAAQPARRLLARRRRHLRRHRQPDRARLPRPLSRPPTAPTASARSACRLHGPEPLLRAPHGRRSCWPGCRPPPQGWPAMPRPRPKASSSAPWPRPRTPRRRDRQALRAHRARRRRAAGRKDHHVVPPRRPHLRRPDPGRARRRARALPDRRSARRRGRRLPRHPRVRQKPGRRLPLGLQPATARAVTCFADNSRHASAWAAGIYGRARRRGCRRPRACASRATSSPPAMPAAPGRGLTEVRAGTDCSRLPQVGIHPAVDGERRRR